MQWIPVETFSKCISLTFVWHRLWYSVKKCFFFFFKTHKMRHVFFFQTIHVSGKHLNICALFMCYVSVWIRFTSYKRRKEIKQNDTLHTKRQAYSILKEKKNIKIANGVFSIHALIYVVVFEKYLNHQEKVKFTLFS